MAGLRTGSVAYRVRGDWPSDWPTRIGLPVSESCFPFTSASKRAGFFAENAERIVVFSATFRDAGRRELLNIGKSADGSAKPHQDIRQGPASGLCGASTNVETVRSITPLVASGLMLVSGFVALPEITNSEPTAAP